MFRALIKAAGRFREEGNLPPTGYKPKTPKWIITLEDENAYIEGPYTSKEIHSVYAPDRQRSGTKPEPFLLLDKAQYVFGIPEGSKADELHKKYISLLEEAAKETKEPSLYRILEFLQNPTIKGIEKVKPGDLVVIRVELDCYPFELESVQKFWAEYLSRRLVAKHKAICSICGSQTNILRILPREIVVLGQKCQITSFNKSAFSSFGREQTANAPICFDCASKVIDALDYLIRSDQHRKRLWSNPKANTFLENQLAVFWLDKRVELLFGERTYDLEILLGQVLDNTEEQAGPPATLSQIKSLLDVPWSASETALNLDDRRFYLAVLSANKGRLVVREWLESNLRQIQVNLVKFLHATRIVSPWGDPPRAQSISTLLQATETPNPNLTRGLLRTAYSGYTPHSGLCEIAARRFRTLVSKQVKDRKKKEVQLWALASAIKLSLFYNRKEVQKMDQLDLKRKNAAYLCGRLLAALEEAQQVATWNKSHKRLKRTIVDRFYGSASTAPASVFGNLLHLASTAHLPGAGRMLNRLVEEICSLIDEAGGFPKTLKLKEQADFALGFYHQRAAIRAIKNSDMVVQHN